jgi:cytoskeleton-associated protein 5
MADKSEAEILAEALKLPLDERVAHSNWKVRVAAYEAIKAGCNNVFDPSDPVLGQYGRYHGFAERSTSCSAMQTAAAAWPVDAMPAGTAQDAGHAYASSPN